MILVTTGTALPDNNLIELIDDLVSSNKISGDIIAQIGYGSYKPYNFRSFRFVDSLIPYIKMADLVISNCGAGTIFEVLEERKPLIVVQNPGITGGHEWELVKKLEELNLLFWCRNYRELPDLIKLAQKHKFNRIKLKNFDYEEFNKLVGL